MFRKKAVNLWLLAALLATLLSVPAPAALAHPTLLDNPPANLLQFRAGGHVVGFQPDRLYLAGLDHALCIEFVGTAGVMPQMSAGAVDSDTQRGTPPLTRVTYPDLWPGIGVTYEAVSSGIAKSTYLVAPGADVSRIRLRYNAPVKVQSYGSLRFSLPSGNGYLTESPPLAWQEIAGQRVPVEVVFTVSAGNRVGFSVGSYDPRYPLTIDPTYQWHTFYGGAGSDDEGYGIAVDGSGNVYVTGTSAANWQVDSTNPLHTHSGGDDIVVVKLNSSGAYQWHTFYGSGNDDYGNDIAVDGSGNVYVTGESWFPGWNGPLGQSPLHAHAGGVNIAVLKLSSSGAYQWHTFYGISDDFATGIAVDGSSVYVTGYSGATWQGDGNTSPLHAHSSGFAMDIVVLKLTTNGAYQWHTFYGSSDNEYGDGIAVSSGNVYVTGYGYANWQVGSTDPLHDHSGFEDLVVLKLDSSGTYQWHTFYGSGFYDRGYGIVADGSNNVYVTGYSTATWNGPTGQSPLHDYSGTRDIVVLKLNNSGTYQWHTFYGAGDQDVGYGIAVDGNGNVYVTGRSPMTWQGDGNANPLHDHSGIVNDIVALKLSSSGIYQWHTFYGSDNDDRGRGIAVDGSGNVYVTGRSVLTWQGDGNASPLHAHSEGFPYTDIVVAKMAGTSTLIVTKAGPGSGTVTSAPAGIDCGVDCSENYIDNDGTSVTLIATPAGGSIFMGWSGDCNGTGDCVVAMTVPKSVTATFNIGLYLPIVLKNFSP